MGRLEIHPFSEDYREEAAGLLADRHARHRAAEPLLPELDDLAAQLPEGDGAVATRGGAVVAYVIASVGDERSEVGLAGCAAAEAEAVRDLYAHLAPGWPKQHQALVPASDGELVDAWFRLAHGCQFVTAVRDTAPLEAPRFRGAIRPTTPDDLKEVAGFDRLLHTHLCASPSFSGLDFDSYDFDEEWSTLWEETEDFPFHRIAELDGRVVGHVLLYDRPAGDLRIGEGNVDLAHVATKVDARGQGVARALVAAATAWAHEQGYRSFSTDWRTVNLEASRVWPRFGWRPTFLRLYRSIP